MRTNILINIRQKDYVRAGTAYFVKGRQCMPHAMTRENKEKHIKANNTTKHGKGKNTTKQQPTACRYGVGCEVLRAVGLALSLTE